MIDWLFELLHASSVAQEIGIIALVCALGMALGSIKFKGISLGSAGVLFVGILIAHFCKPIDHHTLNFIREFGLVLFVFAMGLQLGPGFVASLRQEGLRLNVLAAALVLLAGLLAPLLGWLLAVDAEAVAGLFAGATTNIPALGAAQQSLATIPGIAAERLALPALACAVSYPMGVAALLGTLLVLKLAFRIDPRQEAADYVSARQRAIAVITRRALVVENTEVDGLTLAKAGGRVGEGLIVSRIRPAGESEVRAALKDAQLHVGDTLLAVGTARALDQFERLVGRKSDDDLLTAPGRITYRRIAVTNKRVLGRTPAELGLENGLEAHITRITRGDVEMTAVPGLRLKFGDILQVVGTEEQLDKAAAQLGNSLKKLNETPFIPLFAGIFLGVLVGSIPLAVPGLAQPLRVGLAGGPLIMALALGRIGHIGGLIWHMPENANHAFREFGIAMFFAALGLAAGDQFFTAVLSPRGMLWLGTGVAITGLPLLAVGLWARLVERMSFVTLGGLLSGGMTNPPALAFVSNLCDSDAPAVAYATVYPLTTLLRILVAQMLVVMLCG